MTLLLRLSILANQGDTHALLLLHRLQHRRNDLLLPYADPEAWSEGNSGGEGQGWEHGGGMGCGHGYAWGNGRGDGGGWIEGRGGGRGGGWTDGNGDGNGD